MKRATSPAVGEVTIPSASTSGGTPQVGRMAVRWVHPAPALSLLADGHTFGRDPSCSTQLLGVEVSRTHAGIEARGLLPIVRDLGSRNGVYVRGERIAERAIGPRDVLRIGEWVGVGVELPPERGTDYALVEVAPSWFAGPALATRAESLRRAAASDLSIVVEGETGTGKEGAAQAVHAWSGRKGAFVTVDCGALPEQLAEALLFGHRKGAFTGADRAAPGFLRESDGGTLFLDEVLNLSAPLQAKLLRALERREVMPVGEARPIAVDLRVVCAAQESLSAAVAAGKFRRDLLARLDGFTFELPPLRDRTEDIVPLFFELLERQGGAAQQHCEPRFVESLLLHDWPLNVREMVQLVRRLVALHAREPLKRSMLPRHMLGSAAPGATTPASTPAPSRRPTDDEAAFERLLGALREQGGNLTKAAAALGLTRARAYRLLDAHPEFDIASTRPAAERGEA